ncbi:MAG: GNAT family N-acetyltransferase [Anaerolineae bacterium]|nr:GNAT family N-acetyltransferase [Anaerolineae bacterium]
MIRMRSARTVDLPGVAAVLQDAFSDKMRVLFGSQPARVRRLLEALYTGPVERGYDGVLIAEQDGRVLGTLTIEPMHFTAQERRAFESLAFQELGMLRMLRTSFLLWLLAHDPGPGEAYISDVGVASDCQDQGVGQRLMDYAEQWARSHDYTRLTLWVAGTNARAIHVYQKSGFAIVDNKSSWLLRFGFGIRHWHFMEKVLSDENF